MVAGRFEQGFDDRMSAHELTASTGMQTHALQTLWVGAVIA